MDVHPQHDERGILTVKQGQRLHHQEGGIMAIRDKVTVSIKGGQDLVGVIDQQGRRWDITLPVKGSPWLVVEEVDRHDNATGRFIRVAESEVVAIQTGMEPKVAKKRS
jgi:hypothetical protein